MPKFPSFSYVVMTDSRFSPEFPLWQNRKWTTYAGSQNIRSNSAGPWNASVELTEVMCVIASVTEQAFHQQKFPFSLTQLLPPLFHGDQPLTSSFCSFSHKLYLVLPLSFPNHTLLQATSPPDRLEKSERHDLRNEIKPNVLFPLPTRGWTWGWDLRHTYTDWGRI